MRVQEALAGCIPLPLKVFFFFLNDMEDIRLHKYVELTLAIVLSFITINLVALTTQKTLPDKYVPKINII